MDEDGINSNTAPEVEESHPGAGSVATARVGETAQVANPAGSPTPAEKAPAPSTDNQSTSQHVSKAVRPLVSKKPDAQASASQSTTAPTSPVNTSSSGTQPGKPGEPSPSGTEGKALPVNKAGSPGSVAAEEGSQQRSIEERKEGIRRAKARTRKHKRRMSLQKARRWIIFAAVAVVVLLVSFVCAFRWFMFDDAANIQGKWKVGNGGSQIEITGDRIILNDEVSYTYSIDPFSKTIVFDFGQLEGKGRYRFSASNNQLCVYDGEFGWVETFAEDLPWVFESVWDLVTAGKDKSPAIGDDSVVLSRVE